MNKLTYATLAASTLFAATLSAQAASPVNNNFTVSVSLTSQCRAIDSGTKTLDFGTYDAFQATDKTATGIDIQFECTRGFTPSSVAFDTANGTAIGGGVLAGLNYDLNFAAAVVTNGTAATSAAADIGTGDTRSYTVTGTMLAGQAGTNTAGPTTHVRTLIVSY